jgi:XTP/dITP diphosphohydrolase
MQTIVVASDNRGKLAEIRQLLAETAIEVRPQSDFGISGTAETAATFRENALLKARHASAAAGLPAIADDSGLEVSALQGRPGVRSARFAGETATDDENIDRLLAELVRVPDEKRSASFRCVAVYIDGPDDESPLFAEGVWAGRILTTPRGGGGFGYDPVFLDLESGKAAAELSAEEKNRISHRGQAFRALASLIRDRLGPRQASP